MHLSMAAACAVATGAAAAAAAGRSGSRAIKAGVPATGAARAARHHFARVMGAAMGAGDSFIAKGDFLKFAPAFAAGEFINGHC